MERITITLEDNLSLAEAIFYMLEVDKKMGKVVEANYNGILLSTDNKELLSSMAEDSRKPINTNKKPSNVRPLKDIEISSCIKSAGEINYDFIDNRRKEYQKAKSLRKRNI